MINRFIAERRIPKPTLTSEAFLAKKEFQELSEKRKEQINEEMEKLDAEQTYRLFWLYVIGGVFALALSYL